MTFDAAVRRFAAQHKITNTEARLRIHGVATLIINAVTQHDPLSVPGLGLFKTRPTKPRRSVIKGVTHNIPARRKVAFVPALSLTKLVRGTP